MHLTLFNKSQYGLTNNIEIQTNIPFIFKYQTIALKFKWIDNVRLKIKKLKKNTIIIGSYHNLYRPTDIIKTGNSLNIIQTGNGEVYLFKNEIRITVETPNYKTCTKSKRGYTLTIGQIYNIGEQLNTDLRNGLTYRETTLFGKRKNIIYTRFEYDNTINSTFFKIQGSIYYRKKDLGGLILESQGLIYSFFGYRNNILAGAGYCLDWSPLVKNFPMFYPYLEISIGLKTRKKKSKKLFDNNVLPEVKK